MITDFYEKLTTRNGGIISLEGQAKLKSSVIAIAGCGADGGAPALSLARLGVRNFRLADPDIFDYSNINRQEGAFFSSVGTNKASEISRLIKDVDPTADVVVFDQGINEQNIVRFLAGCDLLLEEIDYRKPELSELAHTTAFGLGIPVITVVSVGWNAFLFFFKPGATTYDEYVSTYGLQAYAPELPDYFSQELIDAVITEQIEIPAIDPSVRMASALASAFSYFHLSGIKELLPVPHYYSSGDLMLKQASIRGDAN